MTEIPKQIPAPNFDAPDRGTGFLPEISDNGRAVLPETQGVTENPGGLSEPPSGGPRQEQQLYEALGAVPMSPEVASHAPAAREAARALSEAANPQPKGRIPGYRPAGPNIGIGTPQYPGSPHDRQN